MLTEALPISSITVDDVKSWHRQWLYSLYEWAGEERSVNLSKDGFQFASARQVPALLNALDKKFLEKLTPCFDFSDDQLIKAIAVTHVEFILIHPFREGNGRIARLLADVMAMQAGFGTLDYSSWDKSRQSYFSAIHQGLDGHYDAMMILVEKAFNEGK